MEMIDEDMFKRHFDAGSVRYIIVAVDTNGRAHIVYTLSLGDQGLVATKRGKPKAYRIETCLQFLRSMGIADVKLDMKAWTPAEPSLL